MRYLYTLLFYLALPFIVLRLLWKSRQNSAYRQRIAERFGYLPADIPANGIWVHAVSVGEVLAAVPLIKQLQQSYPTLPLIVTTMTPTGADRVKAAFADSVRHVYVPYDIPCATKLFLQKVKPKVALFVETELWPNLFNACAKQKIPMLVLNARLSEKSARGYRRLGSLTRTMLKQVTVVAAQNKEDGQRFIALGLPAEKLKVTGSIKFDLEIPANLSARAVDLRQQWDASRPVFIAASTHEGEEEIILNAFSKMREQLPNLLLILVPRHPDRFSKVAGLSRKYSSHIIQRSQQIACTHQTEIFIGDTMGELLLFYACADVAFVGGSLVNTGGHNPLEPAAIGLPVIMGPHLFNFAVIARQLQDAGGLAIVTHADEIAAKVIHLLQDKSQFEKMRAAGFSVIEQNRGSLARQVALVAGSLG